MNVDFNPSFSGYISVEDKQGKELFRNEIHSEVEIKEFLEANGESVPYHSMFKACFIPIRTNSWHFLAKDLFLPTFINRAIKVDNIVLRILASCFAIILDVITLLPRLIATPFRIVHNRNSNDHPLFKLVKTKPDSSEIEKFGLLKIKIDFRRMIIEENNFKFARDGVGKGFCFVSVDGFKEVKPTPEFRRFRTDTDSYLEQNDHWIKQGSSGYETSELNEWI